MKLTLLAEGLQKKLPFVLRAISNRAQLPILSHVLLEVKEQTLVISATDLEIGIEISIPAEVEEEGSITVPAKLFSELVASLAQDKVTLQTVDTQLEITSRKTKAKLQTIAKEEFPLLYEEQGREVFKIKESELKTIFGKIVFSSSLEATRPALSGILIKPTEDGVLAVATDGYRLSLDKVSGISQELTQQMIIPARLLKEAFGMGDGEEVGFFLSEKNNQAMFATKDTKLIGRLIEAEFPQFEKILPTDSATTTVFDKEEMYKAVKTASIFARETANVIKLSLQKQKIIVSAKTPSLGENTIEVEATLKGEENEIAFNGKYLLDVLVNLDAPSLSFEMTGPLNPGVFRIDSDPSFLHLIMPIRTQG